jgi:hypothetical protein
VQYAADWQLDIRPHLVRHRSGQFQLF